MFLALLCLFAQLSASPSLFAEDKKDAADKPPAPPQVIMALPLAVVRGQTEKITLRGLRLDGATEVQPLSEGVAIKIIERKAAGVPNQVKADRVGDTQIELEITIPPEYTAAEIGLVVTREGLSSAPYPLAILAADRTTLDKEPNDGFASAQPVALGQTIIGSIHQEKNVDVYRFTASAGTRLRLETAAVRRGSYLDPLLVLYSSRGEMLVASDDTPASHDARIDYRLPADGDYLITVFDALDQGGGVQPYLLSIENVKE